MSRTQLVDVNRYAFSAATLTGIKANAFARGNWPLVYILSDGASQRAYVGETTNALVRLNTHLKHAHKKLLTTVHLISSDPRIPTASSIIPTEGLNTCPFGIPTG